VRFAVLALVLLAACTTSANKWPIIVEPRKPTHDPVPPPSKVSAPEADLYATCTALARFSCPEARPDARGRACPDYLAAIRAEHVTIPTACLAAAPDVETLRRCGDSSTLTFDCPRP